MKMFWSDMLQIVLSFCAGVYVGTTYEMGPYVEQVRETLRRLEKQPEPKVVDEKPEPPVASSWFSWGGSTASSATTSASTSATDEKKNT